MVVVKVGERRAGNRGEIVVKGQKWGTGGRVGKEGLSGR